MPERLRVHEPSDHVSVIDIEGELTRLDEAVSLHDSETDAPAAANGIDA